MFGKIPSLKNIIENNFQINLAKVNGCKAGMLIKRRNDE